MRDEQAHVLFGQSVDRLEDSRLLTGQGAYVDDIRLPGILHAAILRSEFAHARIRRVNTTAARTLPGVHEAMSAADCGEIIKPMPLFVPHPALRAAMHMPLAATKVRYVGEPVAVVVADNRYLAEDALDLIGVEYDPLDPVVDAEAALAEGAPLVHEDLGDNLAAHLEYRIGDPEVAFAHANARFQLRLTIGRCSAHPIETRGVLASYEPATNHLTVWDSTQTPHLTKRGLVQMLGLRPDQVRVVAPDVGGGFGTKGIFYQEEVLVPYLSKRLGRPVKWIEDRREHFLSSFQEREQVHEAEIAVDREGHILGVRDSYISDQGAYSPWGVVVPMLTTIAMPGPYRVPALHNNVRVAYTNKVPMAPYRGAGRPQAVFVMERLIEVAAQGLGLDPAEMRMRNLVQKDQFPYDVGMIGRDGTSVVYDSGDYPESFRRALELANYYEFRADQARALKRGEYVGIGIASYVEATGLGPYEAAVVRVEVDGSLTVLTGSASHGQSHQTIFAQICADALGVDYRSVRVVTGDTDAVPYGIGTFASRSAVVAGNAVQEAATQVRQKLLRVAAELLEANSADLEIRDGVIYVRGSRDKSLTLAEVGTAAYGATPGASMAARIDPLLESTAYFRPESPTYASGVHVATVQVKPATGDVRIIRYIIVHDCGRVINPRLVEGQIVGGLAQGIGNALYEELHYTADGQPLAISFMDYILPTATEVPEPVITHLETPSPRNPLGVKGAGEAGTIPVPAAITNAVEDALRPFGVRLTHSPLSPNLLHSLLQGSRG